jgi:histidinol-phosphatase (PHP family)
MDAAGACQKAVEMGLKGLVFTDHIDYNYPGFDDKFLINLDQYFEFFKDLQNSWKDRLEVLIGIEMGYQPDVEQQIIQTISKYDFDFVINSVHIIDHIDPYTGAFFIGKTKNQTYERYLQEILRSVNAIDDFDIVGHIGYVTRYGSFEDKLLRYKDYSDLLDQILKAVIEKSKGIELNSSGLRVDLQAPIPGYDILKRYFELGGKIVTIGSDAHNQDHVGHSFKEAIEQLKDIGFKYLAHYKSRQPVFEKI